MSIGKEEIARLMGADIERVAAELGMEVCRHTALCPVHGDKHPSLVFNVRTNRYKCYACGASGGVIDLVKAVRGVGFVEACRWMGAEDRSRVQSFGKLRNQGSEGKGCIESSFDKLKWMRGVLYPELGEAARCWLYGERRLSEEVVARMRLNEWEDRKGTHWLQIPYFDKEGNLVGVQNRNLSGTEPRFRFPSGSRCGLYNLPILQGMEAGEELWIAEGTSDCWALLSSGKKAIAVPSATVLPDVGMLRGYSLKMYPDADKPGEMLYKRLQELCGTVERYILPEGVKDYAEWWKMLNVKTLNKA